MTDDRSPVSVPALVRQRALANGAAGQRWLDELPAVLDELRRKWNLEFGAPLEGGTASLVVAATQSGVAPCVVKIAMPLDHTDFELFRRSVLVHRLASGKALARMLAHDDETASMLLERLGPNLAALGFDVPAILRTVASTLNDFWQPVPEQVALPSGADQARWLQRFIVETWDQLGHPCERAIVDRALDLCERRAAGFDPRRAVLVHGDAHGWNALDAGDGTYKFVDPEGLRSEREHDLGVPMREYNSPLLAGDTARLVRERAERLARWCDASAEAIWEWGFIERVSTGLANLRDFDDGDGHGFLEVARRCLP